MHYIDSELPKRLAKAAGEGALRHLTTRPRLIAGTSFNHLRARIVAQHLALIGDELLRLLPKSLPAARRARAEAAIAALHQLPAVVGRKS